ncbi:MAG: transcription antitermination factor NusB [Acidimicrobiales bacterium]
MSQPAPGGAAARKTAIDALVRIDDGAYANLVLPALLERSGLDHRDKAFVTDLVYGTTRMRRAVDHVSAPYVRRDLDPAVLAAVRVGTYQMIYQQTPPHAAVSATVEAVEGPARGLVNAVLRRVAQVKRPRWPSDAVRLSYPDWIVDRLIDDLGRDDALAALETMNEPAEVNIRPDGYRQDPASVEVARHVGAMAGDLVLDVCAGPGGKATLLAGQAGLVVAGDAQVHRAALVATNARSTGVQVACVVADGLQPPFRPGSFDRVLVDAPGSGLGVLRRRPDARWRMTPEDLNDLAQLQRDLLRQSIEALRPGGSLVYSVCTITRQETAGHDRWLAAQYPDLRPLPPPTDWRMAGRGGLLLPQDRGTDGMFVLKVHRIHK